MRVEELVEKMKAKVMGTLGRKRGYKKNQKESYSKMDKTASIKVDIQSRKAQRLIQKTLAAADRPDWAALYFIFGYVSPSNLYAQNHRLGERTFAIQSPLDGNDGIAAYRDHRNSNLSHPSAPILSETIEKVMPTKVEVKKEMATEKQDKNKVKPRKRKEVFIYGNYRNYYGYRLHHTMEDDPRLKVFKREWFDNKDCLDIGCNQGLVTITIAKTFSCRSMVGIDIDKGLIEDARCNLRNTVRKQRSHGTLAKCSYPEGLNCGDLSEKKFPLALNEETLYPQCCPSFPREQDLLQRVSFHCENFVENIHRSSEKFHTILCLSVTKWIHLNWGDDGLLTLFTKIWRLLKPGGVLLLEPQPWTSYKRYRLLSESTRTNYNNIHLHPDQFRDILLDKVGFKSADTITDNLSGTVAGFDRQIIAFQK